MGYRLDPVDKAAVVDSSTSFWESQHAYVGADTGNVRLVSIR